MDNTGFNVLLLFIMCVLMVGISGIIDAVNEVRDELRKLNGKFNDKAQ